MTPAVDPQVSLAFDYPYLWPKASYVLDGGQLHAFERSLRHGRIPILAIGSNRAPSQLGRKFGVDACVVVEKVWLEDYDIVYAARLSRYGAVPATLLASPGVSVEVAMTWLTSEQVEIMHRTEGVGRSYDVVKIRPSCLPGAELSTDVAAYSASAGALFLDHQFWPLAAVASTGRATQAYESSEILEKVCAYLDAGTETADFVRRVQTEPVFRQACLSHLKVVGRRVRRPTDA
ncbi:MAG: hypothetical protein VX589_21110 [Myxococcota bacterium]|nr:hypothetical protein [Myxococcota bacterium]